MPRIENAWKAMFTGDAMELQLAVASPPPEREAGRLSNA